MRVKRYLMAGAMLLLCLLLAGSAALADALIFPRDLEEIKAEAFLGSTSCTSAILPDGVKKSAAVPLPTAPSKASACLQA